LLKQIIHNGIIIPEPPEYRGLCTVIRGEQVRLTPKQEEMALAWAKKKDTEYVNDPVFARNFLTDFSQALGIDPPLTLDEVDFGPLYRLVDEEREAKAALTKEERRQLAAERRRAREALKARYGYAIVNGQRVELGNYMTEPSGIFMGRGQHPLRGRWKEGATHGDVTLNLSPDAEIPEGNWGEIVWQPESMWVARWHDKLSGKLKYVWLSDTAPIKQRREASKFDKAIHLADEIERVRAEIERGMDDENPRRRMIATACYLIDALCLRVGDEKDPDEADTVGATTLRPEHVSLGDDDVAEFRFLGKDSVEWHKRLVLSPLVKRNLEELIASARPSSESGNGDRGHATRDLPQLFPGVTSRDVNAYLSSIVPGLTAKVFRTHHATMAVKTSLERSSTTDKDAEYKKWRAASVANLTAAELCNHTKKATGNWAARRDRFQARREKAKARVERYVQQIADYRKRLAALQAEAEERIKAAPTPERAKATRQRYQKRLATARRRVKAARDRQRRAKDALGKINAQEAIARQKRNWNLGTSLKSYIDPRVYYEWGQSVDYDVLNKYYPATLRRKFLWVRLNDIDGLSDDGTFTVRPCMTTDLDKVVALLSATKDDHPELNVPLTPEDVREAFLPELEKPWRDALLALDDRHRIVAFACLGPEWTSDEQSAIDVFAVVHPAADKATLQSRLAAEIEQRLVTYSAHHPKKDLILRPRDPGWVACAPDLADRLGLLNMADGPDVEEDD